jgi:hypothetical protein
VNVKAELAPPDIKRNAFAKECTAVYTVRQVHGQPADLGLTREDKIRLVYPCDETLRPSHVGSFLPWASAWPGESIWMTVPRNYLKSESKHYWVLDNSGKVLAPVRLPEKFNCPETDYPLTNERERPSGEIYYDVQAQGIRNASVYCRYAKGQYELYIYWYLNSSAITEPPACFNEGSAYHEIKDAPIPVQHVRTYYTKEEFGIDVNEEGGRFWVAHAEKHSPAFDAGIKSGERILKIGGQDLTGKKLSEVLALLKGYEEKEKKAVFGFQNQNENPRDVTLEIAPYDFFGDQMVVYAKGKWARVELQLDPDEPITEAMKAYWIGVSRQILEGLKEEALACR